MRRVGIILLLGHLLLGCQTRSPQGIPSEQHYLQLKLPHEQAALSQSYLFEAQANTNAAIAQLIPLLERAPADYLLNYRLGYLFSLAGKHGNAIQHYERASAAMPGAVDPWLALSLLYLNAGLYEKALAATTQILKRDPQNYYGQVRAIICHIQDKTFAAGLEVVERALQLYPLDPLLIEQKGYLLMQLHQRTRALAVLRYLQLIDPSNAYARAQLY